MSINSYLYTMNKSMLYIYMYHNYNSYISSETVCVCFVFDSYLWPTSNPRSPSPKPARRCSLEKAGVMVKMVSNMLERIHDQNQLSNEISISSAFSIYICYDSMLKVYAHKEYVFRYCICI